MPGERRIDLGGCQRRRVVRTSQELPPKLTQGVAGLLGTRRDPDDDYAGAALDVLERCVADDETALALDDELAA